MIKYMISFVVAALIVIAVLTLSFSKDFYKILPLKGSDPAEVNQLTDYNFQDWKEFEAPDGKFKVMLPVMPQTAAENVADPKTGSDRKYKMYVSEKPDGTIFMITLIEFGYVPSRPDADKLLSDLMDDMVSSDPKNSISDKRVGNYQGFPSLEYALNNDKIHIYTKSFFIDNTMYVLSRAARGSEQDSTEFNFFANSFDLKKK